MMVETPKVTKEQMDALFKWLWDNNYVIAWEEDEGEEDSVGLTTKEYHDLLDSFLADETP